MWHSICVLSAFPASPPHTLSLTPVLASLDRKGVMERISELFHRHPALIQGFNTFCPSGYRMDVGGGAGVNAVVITTPTDTVVYNPDTRRLN